MLNTFAIKSFLLLISVSLFAAGNIYAQPQLPYKFSFGEKQTLLLFLLVLLLGLFFISVMLKRAIYTTRQAYKKRKAEDQQKKMSEYLENLSSIQIDKLLQCRKKDKGNKIPTIILLLSMLVPATTAFAQETAGNDKSILSETGIIITIVLLLIPVAAGVILLMIKVNNILFQYKNEQNLKEAEKLADYLQSLPEDKIAPLLNKRKKALDYGLTNTELSGNKEAVDDRGLLQINARPGLPVVALKKKAIPGRILTLHCRN